MNKNKRGRPRKSIVRERIIEILYFLKKAYAYDLAKIYNSIFEKKTKRVIYYHLSVGEKMNLFSIKEDHEFEGSYSWGNSVRRVYYALGEAATPKMDDYVRQKLKEKKLI